MTKICMVNLCQDFSEGCPSGWGPTGKHPFSCLRVRLRLTSSNVNIVAYGEMSCGLRQFDKGQTDSNASKGASREVQGIKTSSFAAKFLKLLGTFLNKGVKLADSRGKS